MTPAMVVDLGSDGVINLNGRAVKEFQQKKPANLKIEFDDGSSVSRYFSSSDDKESSSEDSFNRAVKISAEENARKPQN